MEHGSAVFRSLGKCYILASIKVKLQLLLELLSKVRSLLILSLYGSKEFFLPIILALLADKMSYVFI